MSTPLRTLLQTVFFDQDTRNRFAADPEGFLGDHGWSELGGTELEEAIAALGDGLPIETAVALENSCETVDFGADSLLEVGGELAAVADRIDLDLPTAIDSFDIDDLAVVDGDPAHDTADSLADDPDVDADGRGDDPDVEAAADLSVDAAFGTGADVDADAVQPDLPDEPSDDLGIDADPSEALIDTDWSEPLLSVDEPTALPEPEPFVSDLDDPDEPADLDEPDERWFDLDG